MRILIINSEYPPIGGGAGNATAHLAVALSDLGQEVAVLTTRFKDLPKDENRNGVHIQRISALRRKKDRSGAFEQGIFILTGSYHALSLIRNWKPDVMVAFFGVPCGAVSWITKKLSDIPYLVSLRGGDVPGFRPYDFGLYHRLIGPLLHHIWRGAEAVVANSQGLRQLALCFNDQVEINVIPNGVDIQHYSIPEKRDWEPPKMLFVGRLVYQKGLDIMVRALGELRGIPWQLTLVGDGPHRPDLESLAAGFGIADRICFQGWVEKNVVTKAYRDANLFVFPSRHEGMPNAVLEAMASGLPVVATDIAGNEELVVHGKTGLLVPPENPEALREGLIEMLTDTSSRKRMGVESRLWVENTFTWERVAKQYLTLIQKMVA